MLKAIAANIHYMVCDGSKNCAAFEYIKDPKDQIAKLIIHDTQGVSGHILKYSALTNDTYFDSLNHLAYFEGFGGSREIPHDSSSLSRFTRAANAILKFNIQKNPNLTQYVYNTLVDVNQGSFTKWRIVYNQHAKTISFNTNQFSNFRHIDITKMNLSCEVNNNKILDLNGEISSTSWENYSEKLNRELITTVLRKQQRSETEESIAKWSKHPDSYKCIN